MCKLYLSEHLHKIGVPGANLFTTTSYFKFMAVITGHSEYGNHKKYMIFTLFDVLKKGILKIEEFVLGCMNTGTNERIGIPNHSI